MSALCTLTVYLPGIHPQVIDRVEFYRNDLVILRSLARVRVATSIQQCIGKTDAIFAWWWHRALPAMICTAARRPPWIVTGATNAGNPIGHNPMRNSLAVRAELAAGHLARENLAVSDVELGRLKKMGMPRTKKVSLAVDTDFFRATTIRDRESGLLFTVAHVNEASLRRKGVLRSIQLLAKLPRHYRLVIGGELQGGESLGRRFATAAGVGERVHFAGVVSRGEKRALLQRAEAYLQLSDYEGFGASCAEAMAAGAPIVVSDRGSLPEVAGNTALAVWANGDDLGELAQTILSRRHEAQEFGRRSQERAFNMYAMATRRDALRDVLAEVRQRG